MLKKSTCFSIGLLLIISSIKLNAQLITTRNNIKVIPAALWHFYDGIEMFGSGISYDYTFKSNPKLVNSSNLLLGWGLNEPYGYPYNFSSNRKYNVVHLGTGLKYYPWGQRKLSYGLGLYASFQRGRYQYYNDIFKINLNDYRYLQFTMQATNTLTYNISKKINIGLDFAIGSHILNFVRNVKTNSKEYNYYNDPAYHLQCLIGYRF